MRGRRARGRGDAGDGDAGDAHAGDAHAGDADAVLFVVVDVVGAFGGARAVRSSRSRELVRPRIRASRSLEKSRFCGKTDFTFYIYLCILYTNMH